MRPPNVIIFSILLLFKFASTKVQTDEELKYEPVLKLMQTFLFMKEEFMGYKTNVKAAKLRDTCGPEIQLDTRILWTLVNQCKIDFYEDTEFGSPRVKTSCNFPEIQIGTDVLQKTVSIPLIRPDLMEMFKSKIREFDKNCSCAISSRPCECLGSCPKAKVHILPTGMDELINALSTQGVSLLELRRIVNKLREQGVFDETKFIDRLGLGSSVKEQFGSHFGQLQDDESNMQSDESMPRIQDLIKNKAEDEMEMKVVNITAEIEYSDFNEQIYNSEKKKESGMGDHGSGMGDHGSGMGDHGFGMGGQGSGIIDVKSEFMTEESSEDLLEFGNPDNTEEIEYPDNTEEIEYPDSTEEVENPDSTEEVENPEDSKDKKESKPIVWKKGKGIIGEYFEINVKEDDRKDDLDQYIIMDIKPGLKHTGDVDFDTSHINKELFAEMEGSSLSVKEPIHFPKMFVSFFGPEFQELFVKIRNQRNEDLPRAILYFRWWKVEKCLKLFVEFERSAKDAVGHIQVCRDQSDNSSEETVYASFFIFKINYVLKREFTRVIGDKEVKEIDSFTILRENQTIATFKLKSNITPLSEVSKASKNVNFDNEQQKAFRDRILKKIYKGGKFPKVFRTSQTDYSLESELISMHGSVTKDIWSISKYVVENWAFHRFSSKIFKAMNLFTSRLYLDLKHMSKKVSFVDFPILSLWLDGSQINEFYDEKIDHKMKVESLLPQVAIKLRGSLEFHHPLIITVENLKVPAHYLDFGFILAHDFSICESSFITISVFRGDFKNRHMRDLQIMNAFLKFNTCPDTNYDMTLTIEGGYNALKDFALDHLSNIRVFWNNLPPLNISEWIYEPYNQTLQDLLDEYSPQYYNWIEYLHNDIPWYKVETVKYVLGESAIFLQQFGDLNTLLQDDNFKIVSHIKMNKVMNYLLDKIGPIFYSAFPNPGVKPFENQNTSKKKNLQE